MQDKLVLAEATMQNTEETASKMEIRDHMTGDLRKGIRDLYFDTEVLWNILSDLYSESDDDLVVRVEKSLPVLLDHSAGLVLTCSGCARTSAYGPVTLRKTCLYCGASLERPSDDDAIDMAYLFYPPKSDLFDPMFVKKNVNAYYPTKFSQSKNVKRYNELRLDQKIQDVLRSSHDLSDRLRQLYPILFALAGLTAEKQGLSTADFIGGFLSHIPDEKYEDTPFAYPHTVIRVIWNFAKEGSDLTDQIFAAERERLMSERSVRTVRESQKIICPGCQRETSPLGFVIQKCPYCGARLRDAFKSDLFVEVE